MRRVALAISLFVVLASAAFVGYRVHNNYTRSEECVEDILHLIRELYDARGAKSDQVIEDAYRVQQHTIDARRLLSPWMTDTHPDRRRIAEAANGALTEFEQAADLFLEISRGDATDEQLAEFKVKLDSGRWRLVEISAAIHKHPPPLTAANKRHLIRYINNVFGEELVAEQKLLKDNPNAKTYQEIFSVELIRNDLEASPKPLKPQPTTSPKA